jgi:hypothetical protein
MTEEELTAAAIARPLIKNNIVAPPIQQPKPVVKAIPPNNILTKHKLIKRSQYMRDMLSVEQ